MEQRGGERGVQRVLEAKVISGYASYGPNLLTVPHSWVRMWVF